MDPVSQRRSRFASLHRQGCFVMPNPWDRGTALMLKALGFPALATTSAGFAFSRGSPDADWAVPRDAMLGNIAEIVAATDLPVNADFEAGYAHDPEGVAANVRLCAATGVAGLSIEDNRGADSQRLYDFGHAVERIAAAAEALKGSGVLLTARCEAHLFALPGARDEAIKRAAAFAKAGADVIFVPGLRTAETIRELVEAVQPTPVNQIMTMPIGLSVADVAALGVRRISVGSALARAAWGGFLKAAREIAGAGTFEAFADAEPFPALNAFFASQRAES